MSVVFALFPSLPVPTTPPTPLNETPKLEAKDDFFKVVLFVNNGKLDLKTPKSSLISSLKYV